MSYRDDREALHSRVAQLEQELKDARTEGEAHGRDEAQARAVALEQKLAEMRGEVEKMSAELGALRGDQPRPKSSMGLAIAIAAGGVALLVVAVVFVTARSSAPAPVIVQMPATAPEAPMGKSQPVAPIPTVDPLPPETAVAKRVPAPRSAQARWNAKVTRAEGLPIAAGSTCTVDATITTTDTNTGVRGLEVQCGTQSLYRSSDRLNGMSQMSNDAREVMGPSDDKSTFTLAYSDIGTRTGERTQVDLDTTKHQASVFRDTIPRFRVELSLPTTSSPGTPLSDADHRLRRAGKVSHVTGTSPVKEGAACVLRAMPTGKRKECSAEVACGTAIVWPTSAPVSCTYDDASRPISVATREGDDAVTSIALETSTLKVKSKAFGLEITLDEP